MTLYYDRNKVFSQDYNVEKIDRARAIMRENILAGITPEKVAIEVNMSYSWFRKMFKDYVGMSPAMYIQTLKMQLAKQMLVNTMQPIKEVAFSLGFEELSYFSAAFKKATSYTPVEYRNVFGISSK